MCPTHHDTCPDPLWSPSQTQDIGSPAKLTIMTSYPSLFCFSISCLSKFCFAHVSTHLEPSIFVTISTPTILSNFFPHSIESHIHPVMKTWLTCMGIALLTRCANLVHHCHCNTHQCWQECTANNQKKEGWSRRNQDQKG